MHHTDYILCIIHHRWTIIIWKQGYQKDSYHTHSHTTIPSLTPSHTNTHIFVYFIFITLHSVYNAPLLNHYNLKDRSPKALLSRAQSVASLQKTNVLSKVTHNYDDGLLHSENIFPNQIASVRLVWQPDLVAFHHVWLWELLCSAQ